MPWRFYFWGVFTESDKKKVKEERQVSPLDTSLQNLNHYIYNTGNIILKPESKTKVSLRVPQDPTGCFCSSKGHIFVVLQFPQK